MIFYNFPLKQKSYIKIGGNADVAFFPHDIIALQKFIRRCTSKITVLGNLSNTLIPDDGIRGCCVFLKNLNRIRILSNNSIYVESGVLLNDFIKFTVSHNLSCIEKLYCVPGTVGGAICMNAGTGSFEIKNAIKSIQLMDENGTIFSITSEFMKYRTGNIPNNTIVISCIFNTKRPIEDLNAIIKEIFQYRLKTQPINSYTLGSTFKNPPNYKAWELIKMANCAELKIGGAQISSKHSNFIINNGTATSQDVIQLIVKIQSKVFQCTGIKLVPEIKIIQEVNSYNE